MKSEQHPLLSILLLSCVTYGCSNQETSHPNFVHNIEITEMLDSVAWSDLVESMEYIPLEFKPECAIHEVEQLLVRDGHLYIRSHKDLHAFDPQGKYLYSVEHGHAKNEVIGLISANLWKDQLCLYDVSQKKEVLLDAKSGKYMDKREVNAPFGEGYQFGDHFIMDVSRVSNDATEQLRFWIWSDPKSEPAKYISYNTHNSGNVGDLSVLDDGLLYSDIARNQVYKVSADGLTPYINVSVPKSLQMPEEVKEAIASNQYHWDNEGQYMHHLLNVQECESIIAASIDMGNRFCTILYDKSSRRSLCYKMTSGWEAWMTYPGAFKASEGDNLYCVLTPNIVHLNKVLNDVSTPPSKSQFLPAYNAFMACQEDDNPIIVRFKLKHIN
ncbi:MAG: 6-bladed beta-propeller [Bacteroidales bacterium]|nr:6-bladed beta-propeller [Bacteroidales bacterium]